MRIQGINLRNSYRMRIKLFILTLCFSFFFASCVTEEVSVPAEIVQQDTLVEMLAEIQIMEAMKRVRSDRKSLDFDITKGYDFVFDKYNVSEGRFKKSMDFYARHQNLFEVIYDRVIIRITEIEAEFTSKTQK